MPIPSFHSSIINFITKTSKFKGQLMCITVSHQLAVPHQACMIGHAYTSGRPGNPEEEKPLNF
jgi:hypothetical protein